MRWIWIVLLAGCLSPATTEPGGLEPGGASVRADLTTIAGSPMVRFETSHGDIDFIVYEAWMPATSSHILGLVDAGFYDGTQIHRIIPGFVIQGGDPTGTGTGGSGGSVVHEFDPRLQYLSGGVGLARGSDPDSGDSQWFMTTHPATRMSNPNGSYAQQYGTYAMWGQVVRGIDVVRTISEQPAIPEQDRPIVPITVTAAYRIENDIDPAAYPLQPIEVADATASVPLHLFADHTFQVTLEDGISMELHCTKPDGRTHIILLAEHPVDVTWQEGPHPCRIHAGEEMIERTFVVGPPL